MVVFAAFAIGGSLFVAPLVMLFAAFMASLGKSLGVRRFYVALLLRIFEYGRQNIESAKNQTRINFDISASSDSPSAVPATNSAQPSTAAGVSAAVQPTHQRSQSEPSTALAASKAADAQLPNGQSHHHHQHSYSNGGNTVITRDALILVPDGERDHHPVSAGAPGTTGPQPLQHSAESDDDKAQHFEFHLANLLDYVKTGLEAIIEDDVTSRFEAEELKNWNLLTRTNHYYEFISWRLSIIWVCGFVVRYAVLMPVRVLVCFLSVIWLSLCMALVGCMPEGETKRWMMRKVSIQCFVFMSSALSSVVNYHNIENRPGSSGICVANHTSPIDVMMLMQDNCYSLIGQSHGGFLGVLQRALARASPHIWFERAESKDRLAVAQRLRSHVSDPRNPPILIFPEGTCINNTSVMQFKKGSFEVGAVIYPVAIKYDPRFGDPFWNSSKYSMMQHLFLIMTSWAIVCDVWYLPPMYRQPEESAVSFANRVKSVIARQGGLIDLVWDGNLKRNKPKDEWKEKQQEEFTKRLIAEL